MAIHSTTMRIALAGAGALGILTAAGLASAAPQKLGEPLAQRAPEKVYASTCAYCHGANIGPIILGRSLPAEQVAAIVRSGQNAMPAFRPTEISPAELTALAGWVETSKANPLEHGK